MLEENGLPQSSPQTSSRTSSLSSPSSKDNAITNALSGTISVIDDDPEVLSFVTHVMRRAGVAVRTFSSAREALGKPELAESDLVICDLRMPEMDGLQFILAFKKACPQVPVILATAFGSVGGAIEAMKNGAHDYILKPFSPTDLRTRIERALHLRQLERQNEVLRESISRSRSFEGLIANNAMMRRIFELVDRVAATSASVLITGESGTGKEVVARAIHNRSLRAQEPFIAVNCAAIPETLLESELFGHAKGAFTGAVVAKKGLFEEANGGTLFLDEIGEMPAHLQAKLLRVLQEKKIRPVGTNHSKSVDIRILAATHRELGREIREGRFREDLYYRLNVIPIQIPPLRQRPEDVPLLANFFLKNTAAKHNSAVRSFTAEAMAKLLNRTWPGNVRELENTVERAVVLSPGSQVLPEHIELTSAAEQTENSDSIGFSTKSSEKLSLRELEKKYIAHVLEYTKGHKEAAAQILGINRKTLYRKEIEYGLVAPPQMTDLSP